MTDSRLRRVWPVVGLALLAQPRAGAANPPARKEIHLAVVLLAEPVKPSGPDIERAFAAFAGKGQRLRFRAGKARPPKAAEPPEFELGPGSTATVTLVPTPVPNHEAEDAARYSVSALDGRWKLGPHRAQLVVTAPEDARSAETLSSFTSLVAAVAQASSAVGVYCGDAGATHDPKFFEDIARERDPSSRLVLWSGVSIARQEDGRLGLLSLGCKQLALPDVLLVVPSKRADDAISTLFDLIGYEVLRGHALPEGESVGRTASEKVRVHYVPSPVDPLIKVWRVELP